MKQAIALIAAIFATRTAFPPHAENASAERLLATIERFGGDLERVRWGDVPCGFLQHHANTIRTLRAQIISNAPPVWRSDIEDVFHTPAPPLRIHVRLFAILSADAALQTNNAAAWADLHAMWILDRALFDRPEPASIRTALLGRRMVLDAARRLSGRSAWWHEVESFDARPAQARATAYDVWLTAMQIYKTIV